jgi:hypothetical protein
MGTDEIERDLIGAQQINTIVDWGVQQYGPEFAERLRTQTGIEQTKVLHVRPSRSLSSLAYDIFDETKLDADANIKWVLRKIHDQGTPESGSVTLSCLLFDKLYTCAAEDLGFRDAQAMESDFLDFFGQKPL